MRRPTTLDVAVLLCALAVVLLPAIALHACETRPPAAPVVAAEAAKLFAAASQLMTYAGQSGGGSTAGTGAITSGALTLGSDLQLNLDREPAVSCAGWDYATRTPIGCKPDADLSVEVLYAGRAYHLTRLELRAAVERQIADAKKGGR